MIDLNGKTLSSHLSRNFVLASGMLEGGKNYRLILFAWEEGEDVLDFRTVRRPLFISAIVQQSSLARAAIENFSLRSNKRLPRETREFDLRKGLDFLCRPQFSVSNFLW